ncbi:hypothetical protein DSCO28_47320 [Desulfosarcina ovata subsp. sediminis]|uniref:Uncharacterized protein n=2 Tax=Desulfosarcina ovata TaxID=83564 RepID=A0A5K8AFG7_9BACT|nr:hypothetical protein DSCO28_47320 [Desulfosarcina ovata subsp. sediminis]BBO90674.1 hypothetical protein DSCOOX_38540 [Desulfosarcina ovata subsp. ovata]
MATQLNWTAFMAMSCWIAGRATLTDEIMNGPMKEVRVATKMAERSRADCRFESDEGIILGVAREDISNSALLKR